MIIFQQNQNDVETIIRAQKNLLQRFEKTNEMLLNVNHLSQSRIKIATEEFKKNSKLLIDMKKDLEYIFKKIRVMKTKLEQKYPEAFEEARRIQSTSKLEEEDEFEERKSENKSDEAEKSNIDYVKMEQSDQNHQIQTLQGQFQNQNSLENDSSDTS